MFRGRYGVDRLNLILLIAAAALSVASMLLRSVQVAPSALSVLSLALLAIVLFRMFSRNFAARQTELEKYMNFENRLRACGRRLLDRKNYKYLSCPQCMQKLRVPRGKGRLRVTCTRCGNKFETKS